MSLQAGQLLIARLHLTLEDGITPVNTGLRQASLALPLDPPLGGTDPTTAAAGIPSRVQVIPQAPIGPWYDGNVYHSEPYIDPTTATVWVDFWVEDGTGPLELNVEFWDPHTKVAPMTCDSYNVLTCSDPESGAGFITEQGTGASGSGANNMPVDELALVVVAVRFSGSYTDDNIIVADDAGWTVAERQHIDLGGGDGIQFAVFYRIATAADPASYSFSWTVGGGDDATWFINGQSFSNFDQAAPIQSDGAELNTTPDDPFVMTAPSLTAVASGVALPLLVTAWLVDQSDANPGPLFSLLNPPPGLFVLQIQASPVGEPELMMCVFLWPALSAAGATGAKLAQWDDPANAGLGYSILITPGCGVFPDGTNPPPIPDPDGP